MILSGLNPLLAIGPQPKPGEQVSPLGYLVPLGLMVVMFYFALIRPQQKKQKEHTQLLKTIHSGDKIVTNSGIVAVVVTVKDKTLTVRSADSKFEITKAAVAEITERSGEASAD